MSGLLPCFNYRRRLFSDLHPQAQPSEGQDANDPAIPPSKRLTVGKNWRQIPQLWSLKALWIEPASIELLYRRVMSLIITLT